MNTVLSEEDRVALEKLDAKKTELLKKQASLLHGIKSQASVYGIVIGIFPKTSPETGAVTTEIPEIEESKTDVAEEADITPLEESGEDTEMGFLEKNFPSIYSFRKKIDEALSPATDELQAITHQASGGLTSKVAVDLTVPEVKTGGRVVVLYAGKLIEVALPDGMILEQGDQVELHQSTHQIVGKALVEPIGSTSIVSRVLTEQFCEVGDEGTRIVYSGKFGTELAKGDLVVLDPSETIILRKLEPQAPFSANPEARFTWDDIAGQEKAIKKLKRVVENPFRHPKLYAAYGNKGNARGILILGPPGNGKTMIAEAVATSLAKSLGPEKAAGGYFYVSAPDFLESLVGLGEKRIKLLFEAGKAYHKRTGVPAVLVIDECEAVLKKRGTGVSSDISDTYVPAFLTGMNGIGDSKVLTIIITNRPDILDPAIVRDKRIDIKIVVEQPKREDVPTYFGKHLRGIKLAEGVDLDKVIRETADELWKDDYSYFKLPVKPDQPEANFTLKELVSGAMIAGIVDEAVALARDRDIEANSEVATGITAQDLKDAIVTKFEEQKHLDLSDYIRSFAERYRKEISGKETQRQTTGS